MMEKVLPRHKAKGSLFITPPKMLGTAAPPIMHAMKKRTSSTSLTSSRSSTSSSGYASDNPAFRPEGQSEPRPSTQLVNALQNPTTKDGVEAAGVQSLTQGLTLRPHKINTNNLPRLPSPSPVDYRSVSQVSVHVNTPRGRQRIDSRQSSNSIGSEPFTPRPITPVEMQEKEPDW